MKTQRTKFNVEKATEKRTYNGIVFDSQMEMKYYLDVVLPQMRSGDITHCELQKKYELQPQFVHDGITVRPIVYVADFYLEYADGSSIVIDTKGFADSCAKMKRKMFWYKYQGITYKWVCYSKMDGGWCNYDDVQKRRRSKKRKEKKGE